jgi:hypothetical protein
VLGNELCGHSLEVLKNANTLTRPVALFAEGSRVLASATCLQAGGTSSLLIGAGNTGLSLGGGQRVLDRQRPADRAAGRRKSTLTAIELDESDGAAQQSAIPVDRSLLQDNPSGCCSRRDRLHRHSCGRPQRDAHCRQRRNLPHTIRIGGPQPDRKFPVVPRVVGEYRRTARQPVVESTLRRTVCSIAHHHMPWAAASHSTIRWSPRRSGSCPATAKGGLSRSPIAHVVPMKDAARV